MWKTARPIVGLCAMFGACASSAEAPSWVQADQARGAWQGVQYTYGSGEGLAVSRQAYAGLTAFVLAEIETPPVKWSGLVLDTGKTLRAPGCNGTISCALGAPVFGTCSPASKPAVIFDADETLLLNLGQEYAAVALNQAYSVQRWERWERDSAQHVAAVPGAKAALAALRAKGVKVIVITNRDATATTKDPRDPKDFADYTVSALAAAGLGAFHHRGPDQDIFLKGENGDSNSDKDHRRELVSSRYCVLAMAGDQLGDFSDLFGKLDPVARRKAADGDAIGKLWGNGWFVLPNPIYGSAVPYPGDVDNVFPSGAHWSDPPAP